MISWRRTPLIAVALVLAACTQGSPSGPSLSPRPGFAIVDAARGATTGFYWRAPTVPVNPTTTGTIDAGALAQLRIEICKLNAGQTACTGSLTATYTSSSSTRIQYNASTQEYWVGWKTNKNLGTSDFYRIRAFRNTTELGLIDVDVVSNASGLAGVDRSRYVGVIRGNTLDIRFQLMQSGVAPYPAPTLEAWAGASAVQNVGVINALGGNMSGLAYEGTGSATPGVLWASKNGPGMLYRLIRNGSTWSSDASNGWGAGKTLRYPNGSGSPDAEGVTFAGSTAGGIYVATERNNDVSGTSRNAVLRFDPAATGTTLVATREWNLTADLPVVGSNLGLEAITWVPDSSLVARGFHDEAAGAAYDPARYPDHGTGLFFVGLEANGRVYAYALNHASGAFTRVASFASGFVGVMGLEFDAELNQLWATCDDNCSGRAVVFDIDTRVGSAARGRFYASRLFSRPTGMSNLNNEGFAFASQAECAGGFKPVFWADDAATSGHALRSGTVTCTAFTLP